MISEIITTRKRFAALAIGAQFQQVYDNCVCKKTGERSYTFHDERGRESERKIEDYSLKTEVFELRIAKAPAEEFLRFYQLEVGASFVFDGETPLPGSILWKLGPNVISTEPPKPKGSKGGQAEIPLFFQEGITRIEGDAIMWRVHRATDPAYAKEDYWEGWDAAWKYPNAPTREAEEVAS